VSQTIKYYVIKKQKQKNLQPNDVTCCLTCSVCSIALGKFFNVQMGMDFSGGSCDEEYDSVMCGITTC